MTATAELIRQLPKVELHCHLEGCVRPTTLVELAAANGIDLPAADPTELFAFTSLAEFLEVFSLVCSSLRNVDDFHRITYEALTDAAAAGVRYREMFFSPGFVADNGIGLDEIWVGIRTGMLEAQHDLDIRCRMILDVDKVAAPSAAVELVEFAARQDRDELIGIGADNTERGIDHTTFAPAFELAGRSGLRRTMHAGEDGPADNIAIAIRQLGCERIDHGVRLLDDPDLTAEVVDRQIPFTVCPISNVVLTATVPSVAEHPFDALRRAGVLVTINSDDPALSGTTIADDYEQVATAFGYDFDTMVDLTLRAIDATWAPADERRGLTDRFRRDIVALRAQRPEDPS